MRMVSFAFAGVEPEVMGIGPIPSTEKALRKAGLSITDIGLFELNEAFAVQVLSFLDHFGIDDEDPRVNPWGGAIAIGHPLASSGVRLMIQLARQFEEHPEVRYGLTAMCVGLGQGGSVIWENPHFTGSASNGGTSRRSPSTTGIDFGKLVALDPDEVVTHSFVRDITLPSGKRARADHARQRPRPHPAEHARARRRCSSWPACSTSSKPRARRRRSTRVAVTGKPFILAAGADLSQRRRDPGPRDRPADGAARPRDARQARRARRPVVRLHQRTRARRRRRDRAERRLPHDRLPSVPAFALPEVFLGIIPGWGGAWLLPNLIGIENALEVVISNPLKNNRMLKGQKALRPRHRRRDLRPRRTSSRTR